MINLFEIMTTYPALQHLRACSVVIDGSEPETCPPRASAPSLRTLDLGLFLQGAECDVRVGFPPDAPHGALTRSTASATCIAPSLMRQIGRYVALRGQNLYFNQLEWYAPSPLLQLTADDDGGHGIQTPGLQSFASLSRLETFMVLGLLHKSDRARSHGWLRSGRG